MDELCVQEGLKTHLGLVGGISERLKENWNQNLNFWVLDHGADLSESRVPSILYLGMGISQHLHQAGDDARETGRQLLRSAEGHGSEQLSTAGLGPPRVLLQRRQEGGQNQLHPVAAQVSHDGPRSSVRSLPHVLIPVPETEEEVGKEVDNIRLKQPAQKITETLKGKQRSLSVPIVLLVLDGVLQ